MKLFLATLQFMTRLPIPQSWTEGFDFKETPKGIIWFPIVGAIVGLIATVVFYICHTWLSWNGYVSAAVYLLVIALVTGGFHLDGLADTCDGIFSARTRERMLEIMKDSRLGTHGGLALIFVILLKVVLIGQLVDVQPQHGFAILFTAPIVSRACMSIQMYQQHYARDKGLGNVFIGQITGAHYVMCLVMGLVFCLVLGGSVFGMIITMIWAYALRTYLNSVLGGQTGDTLGAGNELAELVYWFAAQ